MLNFHIIKLKVSYLTFTETKRMRENQGFQINPV